MILPRVKSYVDNSIVLVVKSDSGIEKKADFFRTQVFPMNKAGLRFYERNGFSVKMITIEAPL